MLLGLWIFSSPEAKKDEELLSYEQYALVNFAITLFGKVACISSIHSALPFFEAENQSCLLPLALRVKHIFT